MRDFCKLHSDKRLSLRGKNARSCILGSFLSVKYFLTGQKRRKGWLLFMFAAPAPLHDMFRASRIVATLPTTMGGAKWTPTGLPALVAARKHALLPTSMVQTKIAPHNMFHASRFFTTSSSTVP